MIQRTKGKVSHVKSEGFVALCASGAVGVSMRALEVEWG